MPRNRKRTTEVETETLGVFKTAAEADGAINRLFDSGTVISAGWAVRQYSTFKDSTERVHGPTVIIENTSDCSPACIVYCQDTRTATKLYDLLRDVLDIRFAW